MSGIRTYKQPWSERKFFPIGMDLIWVFILLPFLRMKKARVAGRTCWTKLDEGFCPLDFLKMLHLGDCVAASWTMPLPTKILPIHLAIWTDSRHTTTFHDIALMMVTYNYRLLCCWHVLSKPPLLPLVGLLSKTSVHFLPSLAFLFLFLARFAFLNSLTRLARSSGSSSAQ